MWQTKLKALVDWWETAQGARLLQKETTHVTKYLNQSVAGSILLFAPPSYLAWDKNISKLQILRVDVLGKNSGLATLPTLNLIVLPHLLSYTNDMETWIAESWKRLTPGGKLIITGYSKWSLWLACLFFIRGAPKQENGFIKIRYTLHKNGFQCVKVKRFFSGMGGYVIVAQKMELTIKLPEQKWSRALNQRSTVCQNMKANP
jgi:hypothetical protein